MTPRDLAAKICSEVYIHAPSGCSHNVIGIIESLLDAALEEARSSEFSRLMGAAWPKDMEADLRRLLGTRTITGEVDLNWLEDSVGEMLNLSIQKAKAAGYAQGQSEATEDMEQIVKRNVELAYDESAKIFDKKIEFLTDLARTSGSAATQRDLRLVTQYRDEIRQLKEGLK